MPTITPAAPPRAEPMAKVMVTILLILMPIKLAVSLSWATARMALPIFVFCTIKVSAIINKRDDSKTSISTREIMKNGVS